MKTTITAIPTCTLRTRLRSRYLAKLWTLILTFFLAARDCYASTLRSTASSKAAGFGLPWRSPLNNCTKPGAVTVELVLPAGNSPTGQIAPGAPPPEPLGKFKIGRPRPAGATGLVVNNGRRQLVMPLPAGWAATAAGGNRWRKHTDLEAGLNRPRGTPCIFEVRY